MIMTLHAAVACGSQGSLPSSVRSFHEVKEKTENVELEGISADYGKLAKELEKASPLAAINKAFLQKFRNGSAFSFSEADDVSLILQSVVSSQDTGSLNSQNYKLLDGVEKYYGIDIKYMHQECCQVAKVRPLRRALEDLCAWITGQRKDQSPGTRTSFPVLQIDPSFEGHGDGTISLVKWNPGANLGGHVKWNFLETMDVPVNSLHALGYVSTGCETFTRPAFPWQHKREGRWCWEEGEVKECGLRKGNIESEDAQLSEHINGVVSFTNVNDPIADVFNSQNLISLSRTGMEILSALENRTEPWLDVLYAPWRGFCQAMEDSYLELAAKLVNAKVKIGKLRVDGEHKAFAKQKLQLRSFTTTVIFPTSRSIKYSSEKRDIDSQLAFVNSLQW